MDKKIILSVLIVALIGIVAATYQINTGGDVLNPLASVDTEESEVTEVLSAPQTQEEAQTQTDAKAQADAQAKAQAQQEQDKAKAQAEAQTQSQPESQTNTQDESQSQTTTTGSTEASSTPITSGDTIVVPGSNSGSEGSTDNNAPSTNDGSTDNSASTTEGTTSTDGTTNDNTQTTDTNNNQQDTTTNTNNNQQDTTTDSTGINDEIKSSIQSIIQGKVDSDKLTLDMDNCQLEDGFYKVPAYYKGTSELAGTFYVNVNNNNWHFIDRNGNYQTEETPTPGAEGNGQLVTDQ